MSARPGRDRVYYFLWIQMIDKGKFFILDPLCISEGAEGFTFYKELGIYGITINNTFTKMKLCNYTADHTQTAPALQYCQ